MANQFFDSCKPLIQSGNTVSISVSQDLTSAAGDQITFTGPPTVQIRVDGPQFQITEADIAGVYPAPGSQDSPPEFLPHIALSRRTLPWERTGPAAGAPWMALLVLSAEELSPPPLIFRFVSVVPIRIADLKTMDAASYQRFHQVMQVDDQTQANVVTIRNDILARNLPAIAELEFLCHMRRAPVNGVDQDTAIVIANRLPDPVPSGGSPSLHTAFLVSLENRSDLYSGTLQANPNNSTALPVLHSWTFTPSAGGDFEEVIQAIRIQPNGGVLRFGNLPGSVPTGQSGPLSGNFPAALDAYGYFTDPLTHTEAGDVTWRSPLRPFPAPARSNAIAVRADPEQFANAPAGTPLDYSEATAFELGRLLALADQGIREDLRAIHAIFSVRAQDYLNIGILPPALERPDWVGNPSWAADPWQFAGQQAALEGESQIAQLGIGNYSGINTVVNSYQSSVTANLAQVQAPGEAQVSQVNIDTFSSADMAASFADVATAAGP